METPSQNSSPVSQPHNGKPPVDPCSSNRNWLAPGALMLALLLLGGGLAAWKVHATNKSNAAASHQPEPVEAITISVAREQQHRRLTTAIGTVVALRSVSLRNELPGTVRDVRLEPGQIVEEGTLLVALDVSVEEAELKAQEAEAALAKTMLARFERAMQSRATSQMEVDRARAQLDVANAQITRIKAVIARKTIVAPFRARVGISDVHPGQYLNEGTLLTTLQGVDSAAHVDFAIPQAIAEQLRPGEPVEILTSSERPAIPADIVALDSRVNPLSRSTTVRARVSDAQDVPAPGASVRVRVPAGPATAAVSVPVSALRKGPSGDHVFVIQADNNGSQRAMVRTVKAGPVVGDDVLLLSGVAAGEPVASQGSFKLRDKALVTTAQTNSVAMR